MSIRVALTHRTEYHYDRPVAVMPHVVRLRPAAHSRTPIVAYSLKIEPSQHFLNWQQDPFGNYLARLVFPERTQALSIHVSLVADMTVINPFDFFLDEDAEKYPFPYGEQLAQDLLPYLEVREAGPRLLDWVAAVDRTPRATVNFLVDLNQRLQRDIGYTVRMEAGIQSCEETLAKAVGSCRDTGWLLVQILRHLGLAARFVSGYLVQLAPDVKPLDGPAGPTADFTDLHAWAEVYVPGAGWIGLDPTSGLFAGEGHIPLACTPDPATAAPVTGATEVTEVDFKFFNEVKRIHEDPRVTKPYTTEQWAEIDALGLRIDSDLRDEDVRLTMGGEPTFVSIDDMDGDEWNTTASGPTKRLRAGELLKRLQRRFAPGGVLHYGQGKWYPGELLPRWALTCLWRIDGVPVWNDPTLLADEETEYGLTTVQALRFLHALALRLGIAGDLVIPGFEDAFYYLWKEGTLPHNVDPLRADLTDPLERRKLAELLQRGLGSETGFALPLRWMEHPVEGGRWQSARWTFRRGRMYLVPGDSPMGYRLPLDSLPWIDPADREVPHERSLFDELPPLGDLQGQVARRYSQIQPGSGGHAGWREQVVNLADEPDPAAFIRTAICVEPRHGRLYVFLPPLTHIEHLLDLIACVEATAAELQTPVILEGYEAPRDWRLRRFQITPDPGVIEVNIHPAASWDELRNNTATLYEEARSTRLGTEKFMLDGRHTGTGADSLSWGMIAHRRQCVHHHPRLLRCSSVRPRDLYFPRRHPHSVVRSSRCV
ncbi:MAG: transglutaminase family protein, partial [Deltaproteobacteria bacterium]|nr:transglutaminase family protein [Deltaproteobacteria bacterium]